MQRIPEVWRIKPANGTQAECQRRGLSLRDVHRLVHQALIRGLDLLLERLQVLLYLLHLVLVRLLFILRSLLQLPFQILALAVQLSLHRRLLVLRGLQATFKLLDLLLGTLFLSRQLTFFQFKVALLFIQEDGEVLDLRLLGCDGLD